MNEITISSITGLIPPFSAYCCDVYGNSCVYVGSGTTTPLTLLLPPQFITAPAIGLLIVDSIGCEKFVTLNCVIPTKLFGYLLQEDLFYLLQEDGSKIIIT